MLTETQQIHKRRMLAERQARTDAVKRQLRNDLIAERLLLAGLVITPVLFWFASPVFARFIVSACQGF
jgi:hypothetical protein